MTSGASTAVMRELGLRLERTAAHRRHGAPVVVHEVLPSG
jgi:hypothetical protein